MTKADILAALDSPGHLETLYRSNPEEFRQSFPEAFAQQPNALVLKIWQERLKPLTEISGDRKPFWLMLAVMAVTALLFRLSALYLPDNKIFDPKLFFPLLFTGQMAYFLVRYRQPARWIGWLLSLAIACGLFSVFLPDPPPDSYIDTLFSIDTSRSDALRLSQWHLPFVLWSLLGVAFCGPTFNSTERRLQYLRLWGETLIYTFLLLMAGAALSVFVSALFKLIQINIFSWYFRNVVVVGLMAIPLTATWLADTTTFRARLAWLLARLFSPLLLMLMLAYLMTMLIQPHNLLLDRDALMAFNGLLLVVLAMTVFSLSDQSSADHPRWLILLNIGLIAVTLLIDAIALTAIATRLASMGWTPNRIAVLGINLLVFIHLIGLLHGYWSTMKTPIRDAQLKQWIAGYLPVYSIWCIIVTFGFPLLYGVF